MKVYYLLFALLLVSCKESEPKQAENKYFYIGEDKVWVTFNSHTTREDLEEIRTALKTKNISIYYRSTKFNLEGNLMDLEIHVDCNDGRKGSASARDLGTNSLFGFMRDYKNDEKSFIVGGLRGYLQ